jgi:hypothetical protein
MTIKSLLLGSAAVLVAATGARAADAIVAEPEPVEYVRVCDAYGAGWFYIPGTETCLKFDGDVRAQYGFTHYHDDEKGAYRYINSNGEISNDETSLHEFNYRARLNVRANNETEYGTLGTRIRFTASGSAGRDYGSLGAGHNDVISVTEGPSSATTLVDWAVISLAGFRLGFADDYWTTAGGYGFYQARFDGVYEFNQALFFDYTWSANGFAATIGLQDGNRSGEAGAPDAYGGLTYTGNNWYLAGIVYWDTSEAAAAYKFRADYDFGNGFKLGGGYLADNGETDYVKGHAWFVTSSYQLTENMLLFGGYGVYADQFDPNDSDVWDPNNRNTRFDPNRSLAQWDVGVAWEPVAGLLIQPEWASWTHEDQDILGGKTDGDCGDGCRGSSYGRFSLRVVRSF